MAIDTQSLTQIITDFRALQSKDAVSPESLGYILQRIADLLATAGTSETVTKIQELLDGFKAAGQAITALSQGQSDRNHIYANKSTVNLATGAVASASELFIQQATTERAGAMRAQQVIDLNAAKKGVTDLQKQVENINTLISQLQALVTGGSDISLVGNVQTISVTTEDGVLRVSGHASLVEAGCVPYIFRLTRKRNQYHHKVRPDGDTKKYCAKRKGWNLWGSRKSVKVDAGLVHFSMNSKFELHADAIGWATTPTTLIRVHRNSAGKSAVGWGRSVVSLHDERFSDRFRMLRFRFAIAFGKPLGPGSVRVTPSAMSSNLAEFSVIFNPAQKTWHFGK